MYYLGTRLNHPVTLIFGKNLISFLFIKKITNNWLKTTNQFLFCLSLVKYSKKLFSIIFKIIYNFLLEEDLLNSKQSGVRPSDSCINQLLAITHKIFEAFDCNLPLEVGSVFLNISKASGKVWQKGLLYKLKSMGVSGDLFNLLEHYLSGRLQRVALNGQTSSWRPVLAGLPQSSILGLLLFLVYINDLPNELKSNEKLFADDTSQFTIVKDNRKALMFSIMIYP